MKTQPVETGRHALIHKRRSGARAVGKAVYCASTKYEVCDLREVAVSSAINYEPLGLHLWE